MTFTVWEVITIIAVIIIPVSIWGFKLQLAVGQLVELQKASTVPAILSQMHREHTRVVERLGNVVGELSHYIQWLGKQQTGREPPPPLSNKREPV